MKERNFEIKCIDNGIYYVIGDKIPIQLIVTKKLSSEENLWLKNLTDDLEETAEAENLLRDYQNHVKDTLYQSIMNIIVQANKEKFKEGKNMCDALRELMKDEFDAKKLEGKEIGKEIGEKLINDLNIKLAQSGRTDDIIKAAKDKEYQNKLIQEFGL